MVGSVFLILQSLPVLLLHLLFLNDFLALDHIPSAEGTDIFAFLSGTAAAYTDRMIDDLGASDLVLESGL